MYEKYQIKETWLDRHSIPQFTAAINGHYEHDEGSLTAFKC